MYENYYYIKLLDFINDQFKLYLPYNFSYEKRIKIYIIIKSVTNYLYFYINVINKDEYIFINSKLLSFLEYNNIDKK